VSAGSHGRPSRAHRALALACLAGAVAAVAGCGAPGGGETRPLPPAEVPYGLLSPTETAAPTTPAPAAATSGARLYFVDGDRLLAPVPLPSPTGSTRDAVEAVLEQLAAGPSEAQRDQGLSNALGPEARLRLVDVQGGTARVEVSSSLPDPAPDRLPLGVGQVVLSVTSVPDVRAVQLVRDGTPLDVPRPGGARTSSPVTAQDYAALTAQASGDRW